MQGDFEQDDSRSDAEGEEAFVCRLFIPFSHTLTKAQCDANSGDACTNRTTSRTPLDFPLARRHWIDTAVSVAGSTPEVSLKCNYGQFTDFSQVRSGVKFGDGDGTIPVVSLGAMCVKGWKGKTRWNPAGIKVVTQGMLIILLRVSYLH